MLIQPRMTRPYVMIASLFCALSLTACDKKTDSTATVVPVQSSTAPTMTTTANTTTTSVEKKTVEQTTNNSLDSRASSSPNVTANPKTALSEPAITANVATPALPANSKAGSHTNPDNKSADIHLITQPTKAGSPEDTLKKATDALMNGTAKQAASYYHVDMAGFDSVLAQQQPSLQQQLKHLEIVDTEYQPDKTKAIIMGKLTTTDSPTPKEVGYKLQKIDGQWKLVP